MIITVTTHILTDAKFVYRLERKEGKVKFHCIDWIESKTNKKDAACYTEQRTVTCMNKKI